MADVRIAELTVAYTQGDYTVRPIDGLDADIADGELVLLLGPSGSGKTTLLSCLAGILHPTDGMIEVAGVDVGALSGAALTRYRRETVGIVFQAFNLVPSLTALGNVMAPMRLAGVRRRVARARAEALLTQVGMADRLHHLPGRLSGGQQQRVAIARALVHDPPVLIADEPTAHLDHVQVEVVARLLRELARPGRIVIVSTHDDRLVPLADHVIDLTPAAPVTVGGERVLDADQILFDQGDASDLVYVVVGGRIRLCRVHSDGSEELLRTVTAGEYFGEMGPLLRLPRSARARADKRTVVHGYTVREFKVRHAPTSEAALGGQPDGS